jgi:hypothetical protein
MNLCLCTQCPQCGQQFEEKHITNLYAPGNLWEGCGLMQVFVLLPTSDFDLSTISDLFPQLII